MTRHATGAEFDLPRIPEIAKFPGQASNRGPGPLAQPTQQTHKRSFQRAFHRTLTHGHTWYKGRVVQQQDFPAGMLDKRIDTQPKTKPPPPALHMPKNRLQMLVWNPGGITMSRYREVCHWGTLHRLDCIILSETRWSFTSTWRTDGWSCFHTHNPKDRASGVLIMLRDAAFPGANYRWHAPMDGRILHVRAQGHLRNMDFIGVYQHAWNTTPARSRERLHFWTTLDHYVQGLPKRNLLAMGGDFNTLLPQIPLQAGSETFHWNQQRVHGFQHPDSMEFCNLVRDHGLMATSTWNAKDGPTYIHQQYSARLDYIITRVCTADYASRQVQYLHEADLLGPRIHGHIPILGTLPKCWIPYRRPGDHRSFNYQQRQNGRDACLQNRESWQEFSAAICQALNARPCAQTASVDAELQGLHDEVGVLYHEHFRTRAPSRSSPSLDSSDTTLIHNKWHHLRQLRQISACTTPNLFRAWYHAARFRSLQREHQQHARRRKRIRLEEP